MSVENMPGRVPTSEAFALLSPYQFALLKTFRKNGSAVATPIWFAQHDGKLYFMTSPQTGKMKRIRNNERITLTPCDRRGHILGDGKEVEGKARELPTSEYIIARDALSRKYGFIYKLFTGFMDLRRVQRTFVEITPA